MISKTLITDTVFINLERKVSGSSTDLSTDEKESEDEDGLNYSKILWNILDFSRIICEL